MSTSQPTEFPHEVLFQEKPNSVVYCHNYAAFHIYYQEWTLTLDRRGLKSLIEFLQSQVEAYRPYVLEEGATVEVSLEIKEKQVHLAYLELSHLTWMLRKAYQIYVQRLWDISDN